MTIDNNLPVKKEQTSLVRVSNQIKILNKILFDRIIVYVDQMDSCSRLLKDDIDDNEITKRVKIYYFNSPIKAFDFIISNKVSLVISGIFYPILQGINFLIAFKQLYPQVPFIMNSSIELHEFIEIKLANKNLVMSSDTRDLITAINNLLNDEKTSEEINQEIKMKDADTVDLLNNAYNMLRNMSITLGHLSSAFSVFFLTHCHYFRLVNPCSLRY